METREITTFEFKVTVKSLIAWVFFSVLVQPCIGQPKQISPKPNILWITAEDISPHLGCYGSKYAYTPTLDSLARGGVLFRNAYSTASVCTPSRSSIITGLYASSLGTQHLRGEMPLSKNVKCFTEYLREAGYDCLNFNKTDYNFDVPPNAWDYNGSTSYDSLVNTHLSNLPKDRPFFCVLNLSLTHQSQTRYDNEKLNEINRKLPVEARHSPDAAPVPPYYPNTPQVRTNLAALHTQITLLDLRVKEVLSQLEEANLADNTIIFFYSDHGDGLPRHKRWLYDSGTQVPFIVKFPDKYQHLSPVRQGEEDTSLINFVDLAPTMLAITGCEIPEMLPGKVFLGPNRERRHYSFAIRDRVDEVYEFSRSVSDGDYQYIRNFASDKPRMQWSNYSEITPVRKELRRLHDSGELDSQTGWLMQDRKPVEEFYDIDVDPFQMNNLAEAPEYRKKMRKMKKSLFDWMVASRDLSLIPEPLMRSMAENRSPIDVFADNEKFPFEKILFIADLKGRGKVYLKNLIMGLSHSSPAVRYWSASGISELKQNADSAVRPLENLLHDDQYSIVRIAAGEALCKIGRCNDAMNVLGDELLDDDIMIRIYAAMSILDLKSEAYRIKDIIYESQKKAPQSIPDKRFMVYLKNALQRIEENM